MFKRLRLYLLSAVIIGAVCGGYWLHTIAPPATIISYNSTRDRSFIEKLFQRDWYWLTAQEYDPALLEQWLDHKSPTSDPSAFGTLTIEVAELNGKDVGFIAYYMKSALEGFILFIDVDPAYRKKRIGWQLLEHAAEDLQHHGARWVRLITRPHNFNARKLYERAAFVNYAETPDYVFYQRRLLP